ncbi:MAG: 4a-hydroxytetrahydrobiopterin dehydratase [Thermoplasmata archaeon]
MVLLSEEEIDARLGALEGWTREDRFIQRTFKFPAFLKAIEFINRVAELAEEADHHPDLYNVWRTVTLKFTTHDAGGLTERDFNMASKINVLDVNAPPEEPGPPSE